MKIKKLKLAISALTLALCSNAYAQYDIAAYFWPAYHPDPRWQELGVFADGKAEWQNVYEAAPKFVGHDQPKVPVMGYDDEASSEGMTWRIDTASEYGVNVFIFDWYWYGQRPFLEAAVNKFVELKTDKMKFYIMWANHDVHKSVWSNKLSFTPGEKCTWPAAVDLEEFKKISDRWIKQYFQEPNYYKIDGKPVLSIYEMSTFIKGIGGLENAKKGLEYLDEAAKKAGLKGVHVQTISWQMPKALPGIPNDPTPSSAKIVDFLGLDSFTSYQWIHYRGANGEDYKDWGDWNVLKWDSLQKDFKQPYFCQVSIGWDNNPRWPSDVLRPMVMRTNPVTFEYFLRKAKDWTDKQHPNGPKLITINSWNEWTEGSYLEPDMHFGYGYLEAVRRVFKRDGK